MSEEKFDPLGLSSLPSGPARKFNLSEGEWRLLMLHNLGKVAAQLGVAAAANGQIYRSARKVVTAAGTPVRLHPTSLIVKHVKITARKNNTTANTGLMIVGFSATAANNMELLADREFLTFEYIDLHDIYVDAATNNDAVVYTYVV